MSTPRVLVVEDDRAVRHMLEEALSQHGMRVESVSDGREVMGKLELLIYELVVLDILLPHTNGFELAAQIRNHPLLQQLPIVMVSGLYRSRNHRSTMKQRFNIVEYFDKPIAVPRLVDTIHDALGMASLHPSEAPTVVNAPPLPIPVPRPQPPEPPAEALVDEAAKKEKAQVEREASRGFRPSALVQRGNLHQTHVAALLGQLWRHRQSGALLLRSDRAKKIVYVRNGQVYAVKSNLIGECLGQLLVKERLITADECATSIATMRKTGQRQGEILVSMGAITQGNLVFALEMQLETKLFEIFHWSRGEYRFNPASQLPAAELEPGWSGAGVVLEGIRRALDETELRRLMRPVFDVPLTRSPGHADFHELGFTPQEAHAIESLTLPEATETLLTRMGLTPADALRVVYSLVALQLLRPVVDAHQAL